VPTLADLVEQVRFHINDYSSVQVNAVEEAPATGRLLPLDSTNYWNETATGKDYEEFLTQRMPLSSGSTALFRGARWNYTSAGQFPNDYAESGKREFFVDYNRGLFVIPSGAPPVDSGGKIKLSYSWLEEQEYRFPDTEIKKWIVEGDSYVQKRLTMGYDLTGRGDNLSITPMASGHEFFILALATSYFMRRRLEEEGLQDGIFVKDGDVAFDTTKTLSHRGKSLQQVKSDLDEIVGNIMRKNFLAAGAKIDIYSTRDVAYPDGIGSDQETLFAGEFIPWSGDDF
jgi:hypothetical protein